MRRRSRSLIRVAVPAALGVLVVTLAILQYQWLGQVSETQRHEMQATLARRATDFADGFDREVSVLFSSLSGLGVHAPTTPEAIATAIRRWRTSTRYGGLVSGVYVADFGARSEVIDQIDTDTGLVAHVPWPARLAPVAERLGRRRLADERESAGVEVVAIGGSPFVSAVPALILWLPQAASASPSRDLDQVVDPAPERRALIVDLDREYLTAVMLPALLARYFDDVGSPARLEVVDMTRTRVLARGLAVGESIPDSAADVRTPFFSPRSDRATVVGRELMAWIGSEHALVDDRFTVRLERQARVDRVRVDLAADSWFLHVQHAAGSLDAAVALARRRNLYLSFGILSVLVAAVALIIVNARRAERLASQRMAFVAAVSHELRTPLTVIRAAAENISAGIVSDPSQARRYGELIGVEGRRLTGMVEQVLAQAGLEGGGRQTRPVGPVDVGATVRRIAEATAPLAAEARCQVDVDVQSDVPLVRADEGALRSAIENLLANAFKHARDGRWVGISARSVAARTDKADRQGYRESNPRVEIAVTDRGPGIDPADRPHLFEPFYRGHRALDRQVPGSGLGLSLVKQCVEEMGGWVSVENVPSGGSRFVLTLPAVDAPLAQAANS